MTTTILGCGRWGSFLAWYADRMGHKTRLWGRKNSKNLEQLKLFRKNEYLEIGKNIEICDTLEIAVDNADYLIISISSQELRSLCRELQHYDLSRTTVILAMKGVEKNTGFRLSEIVNQEIETTAGVAVWVGPGHVQEFVSNIPNCMLISSEDVELTKRIIPDFNSELIRLYIGEDLIGNEIGAAAKNIVGIAAGILDGLNYSSLKGALMARGSREFSRLVKAMGGNEITVYGLSHIGDYEATLFSKYSNNRMYGENIIKNRQNSKLAEGATTVESVLCLAQKLDVDMPISQAVHAIINENKDPKTVIKELFFRETKFEFL
jgi:glycerol-3-phosphate dehydrogenase (NAD(P)+)